jgi:hypothetical protein
VNLLLSEEKQEHLERECACLITIGGGMKAGISLLAGQATFKKIPRDADDQKNILDKFVAGARDARGRIHTKIQRPK